MMIERLCVLIISVIALWQLFAISYYPVIITIMITSSTSTSTSTSSWTCLKVHCRITIVVASCRNLTYSSLQLFILIPPVQHSSSHLVKLDVSTSSSQSNQKITSWEVSKYPSWEVFTWGGGYPTPDIYTENPGNQGRRPDFHVGFPPLWA